MLFSCDRYARLINLTALSSDRAARFIDCTVLFEFDKALNLKSEILGLLSTHGIVLACLALS